MLYICSPLTYDPLSRAGIFGCMKSAATAVEGIEGFWLVRYSLIDPVLSL